MSPELFPRPHIRNMFLLQQRPDEQNVLAVQRVQGADGRSETAARREPPSLVYIHRAKSRMYFTVVWRKERKKEEYKKLAKSKRWARRLFTLMTKLRFPPREGNYQVCGLTTDTTCRMTILAYWTTLAERQQREFWNPQPALGLSPQLNWTPPLSFMPNKICSGNYFTRLRHSVLESHKSTHHAVNVSSTWLLSGIRDRQRAVTPFGATKRRYWQHKFQEYLDN